MLNHFPDPDMPEFRDARLRPDSREVPAGVLAAYGLTGASATALATGSYNIHFKVDRAGELFDLRRSNRPAAPESLRYESEILVHLWQNGFEYCPEIIATPTGEANLWFDDVGWTLFRWIDGVVTKGEKGNSQRTRSAAIVLAEFHTICKDLVPDSQRGGWPIFTLPDIEPATWLKRAESLADELAQADDFEGDGEDLRQMARRSAGELGVIDFTRLPEYLCHGDYRMRNIQFYGDAVGRVFDFDTSLRATRLLDLGGVVTRFSSLGGDPQADVAAGAQFLGEYHRELPLSNYELELLPVFIRWRLLRDVVIYYDRWWRDVDDACAALFNGAADAILTESGLG